MPLPRHARAGATARSGILPPPPHLQAHRAARGGGARTRGPEPRVHDRDLRHQPLRRHGPPLRARRLPVHGRPGADRGHGGAADAEVPAGPAPYLCPDAWHANLGRPVAQLLPGGAHGAVHDAAGAEGAVPRAQHGHGGCRRGLDAVAVDAAQPGAQQAGEHPRRARRDAYAPGNPPPAQQRDPGGAGEPEGLHGHPQDAGPAAQPDHDAPPRVHGADAARQPSAGGQPGLAAPPVTGQAHLSRAAHGPRYRPRQRAAGRCARGWKGHH
mmetsp:Transcript_41760/g.101923  ORF Transcript_41760/g.101923 Transcript_41760/m.101923 type:complete len:269 (-) Transcript_41760:306-1112(-)